MPESGGEVDKAERAAELEAGALALISAERQRQVEALGYTPQHDDDEHAHDEQLAAAAAVYAMPPSAREWGVGPDDFTMFNAMWPDDWEPFEWRLDPTPEQRIRELVKAGALIVAEIEKIQRANGVKMTSDDAIALAVEESLKRVCRTMLSDPLSAAMAMLAFDRVREKNDK